MNRSRPRMSLRVLLVLVLTLGIAVAAAGSSALWFWHSETALTELGTQLRTQILHRVQDNLDAHLASPRQANHLLRTALTHGLDPARPEEAAAQLVDILDTLDPDYVAVGFAQGGLVGAERLDTGELRIAFTEGADAGTLTTYSTVDGAVGEPISEVVYDARTRPWFEAAVAADGSAWSPVYRIATPPPRLGITLAEPVYDPSGALQYVVEADLIVSNFGKFLADLDLDVSGIVVVLDAQGQLVATSTGEALLRPLQGEAVRVHGTESQTPAVATLTRVLRDQGALVERQERLLDVDVEGERWLAEVAPVADPGLDWTVAVLIPEREVLGAVRRSTRDTLVLSGLGLVLALIVGVLVNRWITRPLDQVTEDLQRVARFELEPAPPSGTVLREVAAIEDATERMKRGLRSFERYVSSDLVRSLIRTNQEATLGVEPVEVTVFFSDIEGFTTLAESLPPAQLVEVVGQYLGEWSNLILFSGGTVDKFIGDAIMAFWNAPEQVEDHPAIACDVALRCQARLRELNAVWEARGLPPVHSRVGLHTDTALVGNLGSDQRMDYTVVGDGVNLASRLEGLNKVYGTSILVSDALRRAVDDRFLTRPVDRVRAKGRQQVTTLHELLAHRERATEADKTLAKGAARAFDAYLARDFAEAARRFDALGEHDVAGRLLAERCRRFVQVPPPEDWDGTEVGVGPLV